MRHHRKEKALALKVQRSQKKHSSQQECMRSQIIGPLPNVSKSVQPLIPDFVNTFSLPNANSNSLQSCMPVLSKFSIAESSTYRNRRKQRVLKMTTKKTKQNQLDQAQNIGFESLQPLISTIE